MTPGPEPELEHVDDGALPYLLALPAPPADTQRIPVLCFLHGYDEGAPADITTALTRHGPLSPARSTLAGQFIIIAPQLPQCGDLWHHHAATVAQILNDVSARHGGDAQRTCLTGFSFGGNGVFDIALLQPGLCSALWPVDPTRVPRTDPGTAIWFSAGALSRRLKNRFTESLHLHEHNGEPPGDRIYRDDGRDHVGTAAAAYADDRIYEWLLKR